MGKKMVRKPRFIHRGSDRLPLFICFRVKRNLHSWELLIVWSPIGLTDKVPI